MDTLRIITTEDLTGVKEGSIAISTDVPDFPFIEYCNSVKEWVPVDTHGHSKFDDLETTLYEREWLIGPRYVSLGGKLYMSTKKYDSDVPKIPSRDLIQISENVTVEDSEKFNKLYMSLFYNMGNKEIEFEDNYYTYLVSSRNLLDNSSVIDLLSYPVDYTSVINLSELLQKRDKLRYQRNNYIIKLGVAYTISGNRKTDEIMFSPFNLDDDGRLTLNSFTQTLSSEVTVEYSGGCVRLFPESTDVTECIIHHCCVVYEELI